MFFFFLSALDTAEDREAFTELYTRYRRLLWCAAMDVLHDESLSEDAVQNAYLAVLGHMDKLRSVTSPQTKKFLITIVRNKAIDLYRSRNRHPAESIDAEDYPEPASSEDLLEDIIRKESMENIKTALRLLPPLQRTMLEYRYLHGYSEKEVAELLELPPKRVNVAVFRARQKLKSLLEGTLL